MTVSSGALASSSSVAVKAAGSGLAAPSSSEMPIASSSASSPSSSTLRPWRPASHVAKCLVYWHPDDPPEIADAQRRQIAILDEACRASDRELLLEIITDKKNPGDARAVTQIMGEIYQLGVKPDWWKLAAPDDAAGWALLDATIRDNDPWCRGVLLLGLDAPAYRPGVGAWTPWEEYLQSFSSTIGGGTSEVQHEIIASRKLGIGRI